MNNTTTARRNHLDNLIRARNDLMTLTQLMRESSAATCAMVLAANEALHRVEIAVKEAL